MDGCKIENSISKKTFKLIIFKISQEQSLTNDINYQNLGNYTTNDQQQPSYGGPRSYANDLGQYPPGSAGDDYKRYLNQNIKQII